MARGTSGACVLLLSACVNLSYVGLLHLGLCVPLLWQLVHLHVVNVYHCDCG